MLIAKLTRPMLGVVLALGTFAAVVAAQAAGGHANGAAGPLVAATLAAVFGTVVLSVQTGWGMLMRLAKALRGGNVAAARVVFWEAGAVVRPLFVQPVTRRLIIRMSISRALVTPLTLGALYFIGSLGAVNAIMAVGPMWVALASMKGSPQRWLSVATPIGAFAGVLCLTRFWESEGPGRFGTWGLLAGGLLAVAAAVTYANLLLTFEEMEKHPRMSVNVALGGILGTAAISIVTAVTVTTLTGTGLAVPGITPGSRWLTWPVLGWASLSGLLLQFVAQKTQTWIYGWRLLSQRTFSVFTAFEPVMGTLMGWAMLSQQPSGLDWFGTGLVFFMASLCYYQAELSKIRRLKTQAAI
ncbi:hypothetical protein [Actinomadura coerulea]|uniref:hypothetical protein n=1 Tax=Actinomadura coerulea TaxID=46159 RepID=UPI00341377AA